MVHSDATLNNVKTAKIIYIKDAYWCVLDNTILNDVLEVGTAEKIVKVKTPTGTL